MDIIFSSLPIEKINEDKTLDLQEIQQIYNFLLTNDYYISADYGVINKLFQTMVLIIVGIPKWHSDTLTIYVS